MSGEWWRDVRARMRSLLRTPVVTAAAIGSIGLGTAATVFVFGVVDAALFRPLPFAEPNRLAALYITQQTPNAAPTTMRWSWRRYRLLAESARSFESVASYTPNVYAITSGDPEPVDVEVVSSTYLPLLRVSLIVGRGFLPEEDAPGSEPVAVLGYELWRRRYSADPSVLGRVIGVNGVPAVIVGIAPEGFAGLSGRARLWLPPTFPSRGDYPEYQSTNQNFINVVGRLRAGTTLAQARTELEIVGQEIDRAAPTDASLPGTRFSATAVSLSEARIDPTTRKPMLLLLAAVACLLALACANVAGLLLGRAVSRRREIGVRLAIGATRRRVVRQLLVESMILSLAGGAVGMLLAWPLTMRAPLPTAMWGGRNFYGALSEFSTPRLDGRVLAFAIGVCVLTTLAFGLAPALQATRLDLVTALKSGGGPQQRGRSLDARRVVVGIETALATILLVAAGLLATSWHQLSTIDVGFDRSRLLTFLIRPPDVRYPPDRAPALITSVLAEIERLPGVVAASVDGCAPVGTSCARAGLQIMGRPEAAPGEAPLVLRHYVGPNHFRGLGVPLLRGRTFDARDRAGSPRVAIINQLAAQRFWPNEDPIGKRVWFPGSSSFNRPDSSAEIIGIVGDVAHQELDQRPFQPDFYTPYTQFTFANRTVLVRTHGEPTALLPDIRRAVTRADPELALFDVRTMEERMGDSWARVSYQTKLLGAFAILAVALAGIGIFAIVAHVIGDRRREIGVRMALGASAFQVLRSVTNTGARPAAIGLLVGVIVALGVGRALSATVYGVPPFDGVVIGGVALVLSSVIVLAASLAARRALRVDPVESLRTD